MKTVDAYIDTLPEDKARIVERIRKMLLDTVPGIEERLSFKIPFYNYYGMFCYITANKKAVDLTFCRGKDLTETFPELETRNRAIAASLVFTNEKEITRSNIIEIIATAASWNKEAKLLRKPMVAKKKNKP